jgi:hypothetical protein
MAAVMSGALDDSNRKPNEIIFVLPVATAKRQVGVGIQVRSDGRLR